MDTQAMGSTTAGGTAGSVSNTPQIIYLNPTQHTLIHTGGGQPLHHHHSQQGQQHQQMHHQLIQSQIETVTETTKTSSDTTTSYQISQMQPVPNMPELTQHRQSPYLLQNTTNHISNASANAPSMLQDQNQNISPNGGQHDQSEQSDQLDNSSDQPNTRFKWTHEKTQVAMNLVKYGCKPKLISVAVGCSLRTAQKFTETVTPKIEGESYKTYEIKRRGRKSKDVNQRLDAIREVLSRDSNKTQVEIAATLRVSNTTVCRDLKRLGAAWKEKRYSSGSNRSNQGNDSTQDNNDQQTTAGDELPPPPQQQQQQQQQQSTRKTRQSNSRAGQKSSSNNTNDPNELTSPKPRKRGRKPKSETNHIDLPEQTTEVTATILNQ